MGIGITAFYEYKKTQSIKNLQYHNSSKGKNVKGEDGAEVVQFLFQFNENMLKDCGLEEVKSYSKYIKEHAHVGYKAHKEELAEGDFVLPRNNDTITKVESLVIAPPEKLYIKDVINNDVVFEDTLIKMNNYCKDVVKFLQEDERYKGIKILGVNIHYHEVFYPQYEELEGGEVKKLTDEERKDKAYVKPHIHIDYIPLVEQEKDSISFKKLSRDALHKAKNKGKYWEDYRQFNDDLYEKVNKHYGYERGEQWEDYDKRVIKKKNGEQVKEHLALYDWQEKQDKANHERYMKQLKQKQEAEEKEANTKIQEAENKRFKADTMLANAQADILDMLNEKESIKKEAKAEAEAIISGANDEAKTIIKDAENKASQLIAEGQKEKDELILEGDIEKSKKLEEFKEETKDIKEKYDDFGKFLKWHENDNEGRKTKKSNKNFNIDRT